MRTLTITHTHAHTQARRAAGDGELALLQARRRMAQARGTSHVPGAWFEQCCFRRVKARLHASALMNAGAGGAEACCCRHGLLKHAALGWEC
eukprot:1159553-Pelagomonas_calceolata.AAC.12